VCACTCSPPHGATCDAHSRSPAPELAHTRARSRVNTCAAHRRARAYGGTHTPGLRKSARDSRMYNAIERPTNRGLRFPHASDFAAESRKQRRTRDAAGICLAERSGKILTAIYAIIKRTWSDDESNDRINPIPPPLPPKYVRRIDRGASARRARRIRTADATLFDLDPSP